MNIAQSVERAASWFAEQPAILAEGVTIKRVLRAS